MSDAIKLVAENETEWGKILELPVIREYQRHNQEPVRVVSVASGGALFEMRPPKISSEENDSGRT